MALGADEEAVSSMNSRFVEGYPGAMPSKVYPRSYMRSQGTEFMNHRQRRGDYRHSITAEEYTTGMTVPQGIS